MSPSHIDHLIVTAPNLASGAEFVRRSLGVEPQGGGEHPRMGTHNLLLRLSESMFLEVIAVNPAAPAPGRPRWFGLDSLRPDAQPALGAWVVRTGAIGATAAASSEPLGQIVPMNRGALDWLITIPADGSVALDGVAPALIEWHATTHPAAGLDDVGLSFLELEIFHHEPERVSRLVRSVNLDAPVTVRQVAAGMAPHLLAHIETPQGLRQVSGLMSSSAPGGADSD